MKNYTITVNGTAYDVTVEETAGGAAPAPAAKAAPAAPAPPAQQHRDVQLQSQLQHRQHQLLQQEPETLRSKQEQPERYSRLRRKSAML